MGTGKEQARTGGRLSAGSRAATMLKAVPKVKVVGVAAPRKGSYPPSPLRERNPEAITAAATAAGTAAGEHVVDAFDFSPRTAGIMKGAAAAAAAAAAATIQAFMGKVAGAPAMSAPLTAGRPSTGTRMKLFPTDKSSGLPPSSRGTTLQVIPSVSYGARKDYFWEDIVAVGRLLAAGKITMTALRKQNADGTPRYLVPYSTMFAWNKDDDQVMREKGKRGIAGKPHWLVELETRRRTALPLPGRPTVLGAAEDVLAVALGRAAAKNQPYAEEEGSEMLLETAIVLKLRDPVTGKPYTQHSDITSLVAGFKERAKKAGICFILKNGRKLSRQRYFNANAESLSAYAALINPQLREFQDRKGKLTLEDVGNWDECGVDLCDYAEKGIYWCLKAFGSNVLVPYEQSPHFTLITGFAGRSRLVAMLIRIGSAYIAPHPYNAQLLSSKWTLVIAQSPNGWVDKRLKAAFFKLQVECPNIPLGQRPFVINCDGHDSNTRNQELREDAIKVDCFVACPPSHTSAATHGGTQQCDLGASVGGPIARFKTIFRKLMRKQHRSAMNTKVRTVTFPEIAACAEKALETSFDPSLAAGMNEEVGYYISDDGYLQCDPSRCMLKAADPARAEQPAATTEQPTSTRSGRRQVVQAQQDAAAAALAKKQKEIHAALGVVKASKEPVVPIPEVHVPRPNNRSLNVLGCVITSETHGEQLKVAAQAVKDVAAKKTHKESAFWANNREAAEAAEAALVQAGGDPSMLKGQEVLKGLIISRTGHLPKAKNNNVEAGETEGLRLKEARAAMALNAKTLCPPSPEMEEELEIRRVEAGGDSNVGASSGAGGSGAPALGTECEFCMATIASVGDSNDAEECDARTDEDGFVWCNHCSNRIDG